MKIWLVLLHRSHGDADCFLMRSSEMKMIQTYATNKVVTINIYALSPVHLVLLTFIGAEATSTFVPPQLTRLPLHFTLFRGIYAIFHYNGKNNK